MIDKTIVERRTQRLQAVLSEGRSEELVSQFAPDVWLVFAVGRLLLQRSPDIVYRC
jgi:hypothetical protein